MQRDRLLLGLTAVFAATTAVVALVGVALREPVVLVVVVPMAAASYLFWYQSSGRLRERLRASAQARRDGRAERGVGPGGGFGAGPRGGFDGVRGQQAGADWERQYGGPGGRTAGGPTTGARMGEAEAYRRLGLDVGADESEVKRAYREKVKEVHPDRGGDEDEFRRVTRAYETLTR